MLCYTSSSSSSRRPGPMLTKFSLAGFASLLLEISVALVLCGSVTFMTFIFGFIAWNSYSQASNTLICDFNRSTKELFSKGRVEVVISRRNDAVAAVKRYNNVQLDVKAMKIKIVGTNIVTPGAMPPATNGILWSMNGAPRSFYYTTKGHSNVSIHKAGEEATATFFHVGVILNLNSKQGKVVKSCISMAVSDFYTIHGDYNTRLVLHIRNSKGDVVDAAAEALDLIKNVGVQAILGPEASEESEFLAYMGSKYHIPIISFAVISSSLPVTQFPYFVRIAESDSSQVKATASIVQAYQLKEVLLIHDDSQGGTATIPDLLDAFQEIGVVVRSRSVLPRNANETLIKDTLHRLSLTKIRIFIVHLSFSIGTRFFARVSEQGMMRAGYVWIVTCGLTDLFGYMDDSILHSMEGVIGVRTHVPPSKALRRFKHRWRKQSRKENHKPRTSELNVHALWAYDATIIMAMAANSHLDGSSHLLLDNATTRNFTNLFNIGVSPVGSLLLQRVLETWFNGLTSDIQLVNGMLQSSTFEIVNIVKRRSRIVGYWTPRSGISRSLSLKGVEKGYSANKENLDVIRWPGGLMTIPRTAKMVIGVPVKYGFLEFMNVTRDLVNNSYNVNGFSKEVFDAVMQRLPYIDYDYVPFIGSYNELCHQVFYKLKQKFDAVVGDVTILANRSKYVDFTQPYIVSGVRMIVPIKNNDLTESSWWFIKPLTKELWFITIAFFLLKGIMIWIFEHGTNPEFQGTVSQQLGMILSLSFSTVVFTNNEKLESYYSKFIGNLWTFAVFILVTSYSANLTSMLAVENLKPTVTDLDYLRINEKFVGYPRLSFVFELLKDLGFNPKFLKPLSTEKEYDDALSRGSANGGVSAVLHEIPYINVFLSKYCHRYTVAGPTYATGGFGFVFPKDSHLLSDVSQAVLDFSEGTHIHDIEKKWFGSETCPDPLAANVTSNDLRLYSFRSIYIIMAVASAMTLFFFFVSLLYKSAKDGSLATTLRWARLQKRISIIGGFFTFKKKDLPLRNQEAVNQPARVGDQQQTIVALSSALSDEERDGVEIEHIERANNPHSDIIASNTTATS